MARSSKGSVAVGASVSGASAVGVPKVGAPKVGVSKAGATSGAPAGGSSPSGASGHRTRTVKQPDERKQEILDAAMGLFTARGYDAVSMRDIARAADITPGLVYHYFDSKQNLFSEAFDAYVVECTTPMIGVLDDPDVPLARKLDVLFSKAADEESLRYHAFFHAKGNRMFHDHLSFALCQRLYPHVLAAIRSDARRRGMEVRASETLVDFIIHGQLNLMSAHDAHVPEQLDLIREYAEILLESQTHPIDPT